MVIDIMKIPVLCITVETAKDRHKRIHDLFSRFNLTNTHMINGEILDKTGLSFIEVQTKKSGLVADAHIEALTKFKPPFLIIEDDVLDCRHQTKFDIPDDADCLYLGSSVWGMQEGKSSQFGTKTAPYSEDYCTVRDMLGIHAVLYLTQSYIDATIDNLSTCKNRNQYCDECIALDMENHKVYCVRQPVFYQHDGLNNQVTLFPLKDYPR